MYLVICLKETMSFVSYCIRKCYGNEIYLYILTGAIGTGATISGSSMWNDSCSRDCQGCKSDFIF